MSLPLPSTSQKPSKRVKLDADGTRRPLPMNLFHLASLLDTDDRIIEFSQSYGLLPKYGTCPSCFSRLEPYQKVKRSGRPPYFRFQCKKKACRQAPTASEVNIKKGTWFEGSKITMQKSLLLAYCFSVNLSNQQTVVQTSVTDLTSSGTVTDFFNYCREVCVESLYDGSDAKQIGGVNFAVEIDEAKFGKRKSNRGRIVEGQWVLGGICRETKECFLVPVEDHTEDTLIALIKRHVRQGSILHLHTDCFVSYNRLQTEGYKHPKEDHSENFTDPLTGPCTNLIESTWWAIRRGLPSNGVPKQHFAHHLAEYIWRKCHRHDFDIFFSFLRAISKVYPGPQQ